MAFFTVEEFAERLKISTATVRKLIREGKVYAVRPGSRIYRIPETEVERLTIKSMFMEEK